MSQSGQNALIIFIKNPEKGKVKTRLAQSAGQEKALAIYQELLKHTRKVALEVNANRYLFYSDFIDEKDDWKRNDFFQLLQIQTDLGKKMSDAFRTVLQNHQRAIIIGSDCASLKASIIQEGFFQLEKHDFVIGPATDGGYYLLGMNSYYPEVFQNVAWSTPNVFPATISNIKKLQKNCFLLPELSDIDYLEDWEKFGWELVV